MKQEHQKINKKVKKYVIYDIYGKCYTYFSLNKNNAKKCFNSVHGKQNFNIIQEVIEE